MREESTEGKAIPFPYNFSRLVFWNSDPESVDRPLLAVAVACFTVKPMVLQLLFGHIACKTNDLFNNFGC